MKTPVRPVRIDDALWKAAQRVAEDGPEASASIRVVDGVHILDLVLPRAEKGDKGDTGAQGPAGKDSDKVGPMGKPGNIDQAVHNARLAISEELKELIARLQKLEEKP
ncbi:MAG TPA: hypothetical protein VN087_14880 [Verrucomicrobiae bacterium]|jgi:hypothetical protein|nr:hypothetical protein [Verrucomicrobiae bacterium]